MNTKLADAFSKKELEIMLKILPEDGDLVPNLQNLIDWATGVRLGHLTLDQLLRNELVFVKWNDESDGPIFDLKEKKES